MEVSPIIVDAVSGIGACIIVEVSYSVVSVSLEFPQAVNTPAIAMIAKNFFIVLDFMRLIFNGAKVTEIVKSPNLCINKINIAICLRVLSYFFLKYILIGTPVKLKCSLNLFSR